MQLFDEKKCLGISELQNYNKYLLNSKAFHDNLFIFRTALADGHIFLAFPIYQKRNEILER